MLLLLLINLFAFSCMPAAYLGWLVYALFLNLISLSNVAAANAQINDIRSLYLEGGRELLELRRSARQQRGAKLVADSEADAEVLGSYLDVDRHRAKFLGFTVTYGVLRTLFGPAFDHFGRTLVDFEGAWLLCDI
jgi:hypothetical protein